VLWSLTSLKNELRLAIKLTIITAPGGFLQPPPVATTPMQINVSSGAAPEEPPSERGIPPDTENLPSGGFNFSGWSILHAAVNNKSIEGVRSILNKGGDPNCETDDKKFTPLRVAAAHGLLEITRLLLDAGADVNSVNIEGITPLKEAAQIGATEVVELFIERGANLDLAPYVIKDGPLIVAGANDYIEVVRLLLKAGANCRAQQSGGWSCLHYALLNKNREMAALVLEHSPDVNASTPVGLRPLHLACMAGFVDICSQLMDLGAEVEAKDSGGLTALRVAVQAGQLEVVKILIKRGARTDTVGTKDGHSLMEVALILGHVSVYQYLEEQTTL
jgi:ankyrin repeat protein